MRPAGRSSDRGAMRSAMMTSGWVVALTLFTYFGTRGADEVREPGVRGIDTAGWVVTLAAPVLLGAVWLAPRLVLAVTSALAAVYIARDYTGGPIFFAPMVAAAVVGWCVPLRRSYPPVVAVAALFLVAALVRPTGAAGFAVLVELLLWTLVPIVPWALMTIARMSRLSAEQTADEQRRRAVDEERMRVAREVHDVVGHSLAVISMQAGVALHVAQRRPEQLQVALDAIARSSREALAELRGTLAVFVGDAPPVEPHPAASGFGDVARLVAQFAAGGHPVTAELDDEAEVPAAVGTAVYRVVQESLTNAARHAGPVPTRVWVRRSGDGTGRTIVVDVEDDGPGSHDRNGTGTGLAGMRERCRTLGGQLDAGPRSDGGWSVHAELPCGSGFR